MIPYKVIRIMRTIISAKNFSPVLTKMSYIKETNAFVGTDSFILFEFIPHVKVGTEDFSITHKQLQALERLTTKEGVITVRGIHELNDKKIIEFAGDDGSFYLPIIENKFPEYRQQAILGQEDGSLEHLVFSRLTEKLIKMGRLINESAIGDVKDTTISYDHEDEHGKYKLVLRRPTETKTP